MFTYLIIGCLACSQSLFSWPKSGERPWGASGLGRRDRAGVCLMCQDLPLNRPSLTHSVPQFALLQTTLPTNAVAALGGGGGSAS